MKEWFTSFTLVLPTSCVVCWANEPIEREFYCKKTAHFRLARFRAPPLKKTLQLEHHAVSEKLLGCRAFEITDLRKHPSCKPFPHCIWGICGARFNLRRTCILLSSHLHFICIARIFHWRRTCVFSCTASLTRLYFSNTSLHPGVEMGTCKMRESKKCDERFRLYMYLPNISIRSAVKREVVVPLAPSCYYTRKFCYTIDFNVSSVLKRVAMKMLPVK